MFMFQKQVTSTAKTNCDPKGPTSKLSIASITNATVTEGEAAIFNVNLADFNSTGGQVKLNLTNMTAKSGSDYCGMEVSFNGKTWTKLSSDKIDIIQGTSKFQVRVKTLDDNRVEGAEKFQLSASTNNSTVTAIGTILDNDTLAATATISSISNATVTEGQKAVFNVNLANVNSEASTVKLNFNGLSASDYSGVEVSFDGRTWTALNGDTVKIAGCKDRFQVRVNTIDDTLVEGNESFTLTASTNGSSKQGTGTILDNDRLLPTTTTTIGSISNATVTEGEKAVFNVNLGNVNSQASTVKLNFNGLDASDYSGIEVSFDGQTWTTLNGDTVNVAGGTNDFQVRVNTTDNTLVEGTQSFTLTASTNGSTANGTGTILDNDRLLPTATIDSINNITVTEGQKAVFNVNLANVNSEASTVKLNFDGLDASDYSGVEVSFDGQTWTAVNGDTVDIAGGTHWFDVRVNTIEDSLDEGIESFTLTASTNGSSQQGTGTIVDVGTITPIVLDLNRDGIQTVSINQGVKFDILNSGKAMSTGWISGSDGFLALDANGNGRIDNRNELFGGVNVGDGFNKLISFDSNQDGFVNAQDRDWQKLNIWQDLNVNGFTDAGELNTLASYGITSLNTAYTSNFSLDGQGNILGERSTAIANGQSMDMVDVYFKVG